MRSLLLSLVASLVSGCAGAGLPAAAREGGSMAWTLERTPGRLLDRRRGTVVTDAELQARGEWTPTDATARRLIGPTGQVRLAPSARTWCDVVQVGRAEVVVPSPSAIASRASGLTYEPRYYHARRAGAWVMLRRGGPAIIVADQVDGRPALGDDAPGEAILELRRRLRADAERLLKDADAPRAEPDGAAP